MPSNLDDHVKYSRDEWSTFEYFINVVDFLKQKNIKTMLDVGGCTGEVTLIMIKNIPSLEKVTILEPIKENYEFIVNRLKNINTVDVINKALFYGKKYIFLGQCDDNVGGWSYQYDNNKIDKVKTITLENFTNIDFIKIDIEGAEKNVIPRSKSIQNISYIEIEFHDELIEDDAWRNYVKEHLPNHSILFSRNQNCFLAKNN
jgi:FkbM family methyltransferase